MRLTINLEGSRVNFDLKEDTLRSVLEELFSSEESLTTEEARNILFTFSRNRMLVQYVLVFKSELISPEDIKRIYPYWREKGDKEILTEIAACSKTPKRISDEISERYSLDI